MRVPYQRLLAFLMLAVPRRGCAAMLLLALVVHLSVLNQAPESAYFADTLQAWVPDPGRCDGIRARERARRPVRRAGRVDRRNRCSRSQAKRSDQGPADALCGL